MIFQATLDSISKAASSLSSNSAGALRSMASAPSLTGYSPIPSMQSVATQHSNAINGATGSSTLVARALLRELEWAAVNLRSLENIVGRNESSLASLFQRVDPAHSTGTIATSFTEIAGSFTRRPPFQVGNFAFTPALITSEVATDATTLLAMFAATNDGLVANASAYWDSYSAQMSALSGEIMNVVSQLSAANTGLVFESAATTLTGFSERANQIAESATILSGHLKVLPAVKAMAVNALSSIQAQSAAIPDIAAKKSFEQAEVAAFMAGPFATELHSAVPTIPNLVSPDLGSGVTAAAMIGTNVAIQSGTNQMGLTPKGMTGFTAPAGTNVATSNTVPGRLSPMTAMDSPSSPTIQNSATLPTSPHTIGTTNPMSSLTTSPLGGGQPSNTGNIFQPSTSANSFQPPSPMLAGTPDVRASSTTPNATAPVNMSHSTSRPNRTSTGNSGALQGLSPFSKGDGKHAREVKIIAPGNGFKSSSSNPATGSSRYFNPGSTAAGTSAGVPGKGSYNSQRTDGLRNVLLGKNSPGSIAAPGHDAGMSRGTSGASGASSSTGGIINRPNTHNPAPGSSANGVRGGVYSAIGGRGFASTAPNVSSIRRNYNDASQFEQNEYQLELFGEEPVTVPAVIGANVRG